MFILMIALISNFVFAATYTTENSVVVHYDKARVLNACNMCARNCGFSNGQLETFPGNPGRDHYHFQTVPGNGVPSL